MGGVLLLPPGPKAATSPGAAGHTEHAPDIERVAGTRTISPGTRFSRRMPVPRELTPRRRDGVDVYQVPIKPGEAEIMAGHPTPVRTYGGQFIGPTIRARTGTPVRITFGNQLDVPANVHLHGAHVPQGSDGHPMDTIAPGQSRAYDYPNNQQGATLWYHDHSHHLEAENIYKGLHGFYIIEDPAEISLGLPTGEFDVPIMLRDVQLDANGDLVFPPSVLGGTILANGVETPNFPVAARKYRFRLLNAGNDLILRLTLGGLQMTQIASDGGLLPTPVRRSEIVLGSAERVDIVVDFSRQPIGSQFVLNSANGPVLRFDVTRTAVDRSRVPARLRALPALATATVERDVSMRFDLSGPEPVGLVNEQAYDPNRVDFVIKRGTTEIWRIRNDDTEFGIPHTFHLHLEQFRVLDRDGAPPGPDDAGRKDTVFVAPGETVRIQVTFTEQLGRYAYHCHYVYHSAIGMMAQMEIVP
ncbi:MAG: multicopper oxidase family protein [Actinophytocola sp.]|uniref:multicopper oxidase family protein n=1 Tax=Actinophytocola sp. TaxID=1872138 RepID=UPI003C796853